MKNFFLVIFLLIVFFNNNLFSEDKKAIVCFDERYPTSWVSFSFAKEMKEFAEILGFIVLNADELKNYLEEKIKKGAEGTIVFFTQDAIPDTIVGSSPKNKALIRKYLNAGGSILWLGDVPFYYIGHNNGGKTTWDYLGARGILGFDAVGNWKGRSNCEIAELGKKLQLKTIWESIRAIKREDIDEVLAIDKEGNISGWIKKYHPEGIGFIRIWDTSLNNFSSTMGDDIYKIFSLVLPYLKDKKIHSKIIPFPSNEYKVPVKFTDKNLLREVKIVVFNSSPAKKDYVLKIFKDKKLLKEINLYQGESSYFAEILDIPLFYKNERIELFNFKNKITEEALKEEELYFNFTTSISPEINPVDIGRVLIPNDKIVMTEKQYLNINYKIGYLGEKEKEIKCYVSLDNKLSERKFELLQGEVKNTYFNLGNLKKGEYPLKFEIADNKKELYEVNKKLIVLEDIKSQKDFGAYYADLKYEGYVYIYDRKKEEWGKEMWENLWKKGPHQDIVVNFPQGQKYVFWRGSGYVPFWASSKNIGLTYEWVEASSWGRAGTYTDCIEPLQDKECRYSRAEIIYSTPARVVIKWRYALVDLDYIICDDEWAEEYYYLYPDGFGVREVHAYVVPNTWHENNEFIILLPAGINPFEFLPEKIVKILSPTGKKTEVSYPRPTVSWEKDTPAIFRINWHKEEKYTPILATKRFSHFICVYDGWKQNGTYVSPSYWGIHWPVTRGYPTTRTAPPGWKERAGHASLMAVEHFPFKEEKISDNKEEIIWAYFIGNSKESDEELIKIAKSWIYPAKIEVLEGGTYKGYDSFQRGYIILKDEKNYLKIKVKEDLINPVLIIEDSLLENPQVYFNKELLNKIYYFTGTEKSFYNNRTVIFINKFLAKDTEILIKGGEK